MSVPADLVLKCSDHYPVWCRMHVTLDINDGGDGDDVADDGDGDNSTMTTVGVVGGGVVIFAAAAAVLFFVRGKRLSNFV